MSFLNKAINKLPIELHVPGYKFCGPGTKLKERIARGDKPRNALDEACKEHDLAYSQDDSLSARHIADKQLEEKAWTRVKSRDSSFGERISALGVAGAMKVKRKLGLGHKKKKKKKLSQLINSIKQSVGKSEPKTALEAIGVAIKTARKYKKQSIVVPRVLPLKKGGFLPFLIPVFAALSALGAIGGATANIASAVNKARDAQKSLEESKRHNQSMEAIALGKGLFVAPYKKGQGLYFKLSKGGKN